MAWPLDVLSFLCNLFFCSFFPRDLVNLRGILNHVLFFLAWILTYQFARDSSLFTLHCRVDENAVYCKKQNQKASLFLVAWTIIFCLYSNNFACVFPSVESNTVIFILLYISVENVIFLGYPNKLPFVWKCCVWPYFGFDNKLLS